MASQVTKFALITGASSGIGEATALKLAKAGYGLILTARRLQRLEALAKKCRELGASDVYVQKLDVTSRTGVENFYKMSNLRAALENLHVLVSNAGLAKGADRMDTAKVEDWDSMTQTNVLGLLYVTRAALPALKKNKGHIVNIGSVAGRWTYPGGAVYCATKAAVAAINEGLRLDLQGSRVRVTNIAPGMVETEFSQVRFGNEAEAKKVYENFTALSADDVAECIEWSLSRPAHVNIQEMLVFPVDQAGVGHIHRSPA